MVVGEYSYVEEIPGIKPEQIDAEF